MKFIITKRALRQIEKEARWWREHRSAAPSMFLDEIAAAERLLRGHPEAGIAYAAHRAGIVRRVLLGSTKCHLTTVTARITMSSSCSPYGAPYESVVRSSEGAFEITALARESFRRWSMSGIEIGLGAGPYVRTPARWRRRRARAGPPTAR